MTYLAKSPARIVPAGAIVLHEVSRVKRMAFRLTLSCVALLTLAAASARSATLDEAMSMYRSGDYARCIAACRERLDRLEHLVGSIAHDHKGIRLPAELKPRVTRMAIHYEDEDRMHAQAMELLKVFDFHEMADSESTVLSYGNQR